jgi:hypothetical protein
MEQLWTFKKGFLLSGIEMLFLDLPVHNLNHLESFHLLSIINMCVLLKYVKVGQYCCLVAFPVINVNCLNEFLNIYRASVVTLYVKSYRHIATKFVMPCHFIPWCPHTTTPLRISLPSSLQKIYSRPLTYLLLILLPLLHFIIHFNAISLSVIRTKLLTQGNSEHFMFLSFSLVGELNIQRYNVTPNPQEDSNLFAIIKLYSMQT